jgi:hypothetical protein
MGTAEFPAEVGALLGQLRERLAARADVGAWPVSGSRPGWSARSAIAGTAARSP